MARQRDNLVLIAAFALAVALHAALLPFVGAAVGEREPVSKTDAILDFFGADSFHEAGDVVRLNYSHWVDSDHFALSYKIQFEVYLSGDRSIDESDFVIHNELTNSSTNPGDAKEVAWPAQNGLPEDADGSYWLIGRVSLHDDVIDADRSNNTRAVRIYIDGPQTPELAIDTFNASDQALSGGTARIDFTIQNIGKGWANAPGRGADASTTNWTDRVYLSKDNQLDEADLPLRSFERLAPLKPSDRYRHESVELAIPRGLAGKYFLILAADADQVLDQQSFTAGLVAKPIELIDNNAPDLIVAAIQDPDRLVIGRPSPVTFSIANLGSAPTASADWTDTLYLSPEPVLDSRTVQIGDVPAAQPLEPRSRYGTTTTVTLPDSIEPGMQWLIIHADGQGEIDEPGFEDNNTLAVPVMVMTQAQADAEIQLGKPENPERLVVQWIEQDRLDEHVARLSRTVQPAQQDKADPTPDAPLVFDPAPPTIASRPEPAAGDPSSPDRTPDPTSEQDARPQPTPTDATQSDLAPRPQQPSSPLSPRVDGLPGEAGPLPNPREGLDLPIPPTQITPLDPTPGPNDDPSPLPGQRQVDSPAAPDAPDTDRTTDSKTPSEQDAETDSKNPNASPNSAPTDQLKNVQADDPKARSKNEQPTKDNGKGDADKKQTQNTTTPKPSKDKTETPDGKTGKPAKASEKADPTSAARDESEAPPTNNRLVEVKLQPGRVLVGEGIEVTTKLPTLPGIGSRRLSLPRNARIRVTFDKEGKVYEAKLLRSTTYKDWDAAIEASLYRWSARGKAVEEAEPYISIEWNYILNDLLDDDE